MRVDRGAVQHQRWIVVADSPFLPARGGGEREHLGFVRAAAREGLLALLVLPGGDTVDLSDYRRLLGDVPILVTSRRTSPVLLAHPTLPFVVASRPAPADLAGQAAALAPDATGVVVFSYKARRIGEALARGLSLPAVLRQHNREGAYHRSLARQTRGLKGLVYWWEAVRIERDEQRTGRADWVTGTADISLADARWRRGTGAHQVVHVPPFALDVGDDPSGASTSGTSTAGTSTSGASSSGTSSQAGAGVPRVLFLGTLDTATNTGALEWLLSGVWPRVLAAHPTVELDVVGRGPSAALRRRLEGVERLHLAADVPDIGPYLRRAWVAVNPVVSGSGVNIKVVEYLDAGLPLVSTSLATQGLPLVAGADLEVHDDPTGFADAVLRLLTDREGAGVMAKSGQAHIRELLDPKANIALIASMLAP